MNTGLREKQESHIFSDVEYFRLVNECNRSLSLSKSEYELLLNSPVPKFIAGIPYLANETNPDILACMNLNTYITGARNSSFFKARENETMTERIEPYIHSISGDKKIISLCKLVLEEVSLLDHKSDFDENIKSEHSNPLVSGIIDFQKEKERINNKKRTYPREIQNLIDRTFKV